MKHLEGCPPLGWGFTLVGLLKLLPFGPLAILPSRLFARSPFRLNHPYRFLAWNYPQRLAYQATFHNAECMRLQERKARDHSTLANCFGTQAPFLESRRQID